MSKFIKDVSGMAIWNVASSAINLIIFYLITNSLGPTEYGKYALAISIISTISLSMYASVNIALSRFSSISNSKNLLKQCLFFQFIFGFISLLLIAGFSNIISDYYNKEITLILVIAALSFLFTPIIEVTKNFGLGKKEIKEFILIALFNQTAFLAGILILNLLNISNALYMAIVYTIISILTFIFAAIRLLKQNFLEIKIYDREKVKQFIKEGFLFGFFKSAYLQSALLIGSRFIETNQVAMYAFSFSIASASLLQVINAIQSLVTPYVSPLYEKKDFKKLSLYFNGIIKFGLLISILLSIILSILIYFIIPILFPNYILAMKIFPYVLIAFCLINLLTYNEFLKAMGKIKILTISSIIITILTFISSFILVKMLGIKGMIISLALNILIAAALPWYMTPKKERLKITIIPSEEEIVYLKYYWAALLKKLNFK
jgi:O-antigen/teichoic acid export membrane protein